MEESQSKSDLVLLALFVTLVFFVSFGEVSKRELEFFELDENILEVKALVVDLERRILALESEVRQPIVGVHMGRNSSEEEPYSLLRSHMPR
jgi:hypothetical protein